MTRPRCNYKIGFCPKYSEFKPKGLKENRGALVIELTAAEAESLRLKNIKGLDQTNAAKQMNISQSTFQRVLMSAYRKVSEAIIEGKSIRIKTMN